MSQLGGHAYASQNAVPSGSRECRDVETAGLWQRNALPESVPVAWWLSWHVQACGALLWAQCRWCSTRVGRTEGGKTRSSGPEDLPGLEAWTGEPLPLTPCAVFPSL